MNSVDSRVISLIWGQSTNGDTSEIQELYALGLKVDNKEPLPENLPNVGMMNCASQAIGTWINPSLCPRVQENCCNSNGKFLSMNWYAVSDIDELDFFKVCQYCQLNILSNNATKKISCFSSQFFSE